MSPPAVESLPSGRSSRGDRVFCCAAIALAIALLAGPRLSNLNGFSNVWDYDEGVHLSMARLIVQGKSLFDPIFCAQAPLQTEAIAAGFRLFGDSIASARLVNLFFGCIGLLATTRIAWRAGGYLAAGLTAICISVSYLYARQSWYCEPAVQSVALGAISIAAALEAYGRRWRAWAVVSGLAMAAGVMSKLLVVPMVPIAAAAFLLQQNNTGWNLRFDRRRAIAICLFAVAFAVGIAAVVLHYPIRPMYQQLVQFHLDKSIQLSGVPPINMIAQYVLRDFGIAVLTAIGLLVGLRNGSTRVMLIWLVAWIASGLAFALRHQPLWPHHLILLIMPMCIIAGLGGAWLASRRAMVLIVVMVLPLLTLERSGPHWPASADIGVSLAPLRNYGRFIDISPSSEESAAIDAIAKYTTPDELVLSDEQKLAYWAQRSSPPNMCDTSDPRVISGYLTLEDAIASTRQAKLVLLWRGCLEQIPGYRDWLLSTGWPAVSVAGSRVAYVNPSPQSP